ncbi:MAG: hypothetical protein ACXADB_13410, partial [Candidatus Hermodarchaeia archaeon]
MKFPHRSRLTVIISILLIGLAFSYSSLPLVHAIDEATYDSANFHFLYYNQDAAVAYPSVWIHDTAVQDFANILEEIRELYLSYGFNAPAVETDVRINDFTNSPYHARGGSRGMEFSSYYLGNFYHIQRDLALWELDQLVVAIHEFLHVIQYAYLSDYRMNTRWIYEGQARMMQDKLFTILDHSAGEELFSYFDDCYASIQSGMGVMSSSYLGCLFWTYVTEQFGSITTEPGYGLDVIVKFWEAAIAIGTLTDPIAVFNAMLTQLGFPEATFEEVYKDFIVANLAKNFHQASIPNKYRYIDETQDPGSFGTVSYTVVGSYLQDS